MNASRWDLNIAWGPAKLLQWATVVGLVDSAREESKARAVVEIYLEPEAIQTLLAPFRYHYDENRKSDLSTTARALSFYLALD